MKINEKGCNWVIAENFKSSRPYGVISQVALMIIDMKIINPINILFSVVVIYSIHCGVLIYYGDWPTEISQKLWQFAFSFLVAYWVEQDRKSRNLSAPFEFAAFMFFLWPILLPFYLFKIHRFNGLLRFLGILFLNLIPTILVGTIEFFVYG